MAGAQSDFQERLFIITGIYVHLNNFWQDEFCSLMAAVPNGISETKCYGFKIRPCSSGTGTGMCIIS